jgi:hypothetical protein
MHRLHWSLKVRIVLATLGVLSIPFAFFVTPPTFGPICLLAFVALTTAFEVLAETRIAMNVLADERQDPSYSQDDDEEDDEDDDDFDDVEGDLVYVLVSKAHYTRLRSLRERMRLRSNREALERIVDAAHTRLEESDAAERSTLS